MANAESPKRSASNSPPAATNGALNRPSDVPAPFGGPAPVLSWIHLSDLHIGHPDGKRQATLARMLESLRENAHDHLELGIPRINAIVVTGDIAWNGKHDQYQEARGHLLDLADALGLSADRVFVVPGNHDVDRDVAKKMLVKSVVASLRERAAGTIDDDLSDADIKSLLTSRQAAYLEFASTFAPRHATPLAETRVHWSHSLDASDGRRVRFIGLNTALLAGDKLDRGKLHIGSAPLRETFEGVDDDNDELVVLISHHPLSGGWLADEREVEREARCRAHLHLCGHLHDAESEDYRGGGGTGMIRIAAGAMQTEIGAPIEYGYNVACVLPEPNDVGYRLRVHPRRWSKQHGDFRPDMEALPRDTRVFWVEHEIPRIGRKRSSPPG